MLIYDCYQIWTTFSRGNQINNLDNLIIGLLISIGVWFILFILQAIAVYTMAKNRKMKNKWLAFIPFANIFYMGKLVGECYVFGHKIKRLGLFTMLAQIVTAVCCLGAIGAELYLFKNYGNPELVQGVYPIWTELTGIGNKVNRLYEISSFIIGIVSLVYSISAFLLCTGLYKKYSPDNYFMLLACTVFFNPLAQYIVIFAIRNRKAVDYEEYMRKKREEFFRRQQQYRNTNGNPNPYGGAYTWGMPNQNPYAKPSEKPKAPEEPFAEFSSDKSTQANEQSFNDNDEFFN